MSTAEARDYIAEMKQSEALERIAYLTDTLRGWYVSSYDGPESETPRVLEMREELGELLVGRGACVDEREKAVYAALGWRQR
jgi:hypothetical protein